MSYRNPDFGFMDYERSVRSCFVGNIPYEASEEELKDIFAEVGTVLNFRLVYDRDSGKPKGYGFAEFIDQETALSAMRNLNSRELHGRTLRVDHATNEKARPGFNGSDDMMAAAVKPPAPENPYGEAVTPRDAPEAISKAVASLPPEQMFELMKQMKQCIQNNPVEARNMLLQNPQLAYALLQAQVVMKIVDPEIAMKMLHRQSPVPPPIQNEPERMETRPNGDPFNADHGHGRREESPADRIDPRMGPVDRAMMHDRGPRNMGIPVGMDRNRPDLGRGPQDIPRGPPRMSGPRPSMGGPGPNMGNPGPRMGGPHPNIGGPHPNMGAPHIERGPPERGAPMERGLPGLNRSSMDRGPPHQRSPVDRMSQEKENREKPPITDPRRILSRPVPPTTVPMNVGAGGSETQDQEKAALIMQVLQLTPEQIALLPEEQRKSILILKEQIQGGGA